MRIQRFSLIGAASVLALLASGCGSAPQPAATNQAAPAPTAPTPAAQATGAATIDKNPTAAVALVKPMVERVMGKANLTGTYPGDGVLVLMFSTTRKTTAADLDALTKALQNDGFRILGSDSTGTDSNGGLAVAGENASDVVSFEYQAGQMGLASTVMSVDAFNAQAKSDSGK